MKQIIRLFLLISFSFMIFSCKSLPDDSNDYIYIMVYDYENNALKDVHILLDDEDCGMTDIYGRYILKNSIEDKEKFVFFKQGYETIEIEIEGQKNRFLYIKMGSGIYYANQSEQCLDQKKYEQALKYIEKALTCENRSDYLYLKDVIISRIEK